jgi:hypothetical protein
MPPIPRIGDCVFKNYINTTKGIAKKEMDSLMHCIFTFREIHMSVRDKHHLLYSSLFRKHRYFCKTKL